MITSGTVPWCFSRDRNVRMLKCSSVVVLQVQEGIGALLRGETSCCIAYLARCSATFREPVKLNVRKCQRLAKQSSQKFTEPPNSGRKAPTQLRPKIRAKRNSASALMQRGTGNVGTCPHTGRVQQGTTTAKLEGVERARASREIFRTPAPAAQQADTQAAGCPLQSPRRQQPPRSQT